MLRFHNYIDGKIIENKKAKYLPVYNPALGEAYAEVVDSSAEDVEAAVEAAKKAFPEWSRTSPRERAHYLRKLSQAIYENKEAFAQAETQNTGKPIKLAREVDIDRSIYNLEFFADVATQYSSELYQGVGNSVHYTLRQPLGVVVCISPWNLPLYLFSWKIAPALATGNTVVGKPSEVTPHTAFLFSQLCEKVGLPKGVFNVVHGSGVVAGTKLVEHPEVKAVSFTGSTRVGREIAKKVSGDLKKVSLELGGKNALVVFKDCDLEKALDTTVRACFSNQGQICLSASRLLVQKEVYEKFKTGLLERISRLKQDNPTLENTDQGAVVSGVHFEKIMTCLDLAKREGAKVLCGGNRKVLPGAFSKGWFIEPTLLENLSPESKTNQQEIFGPVSCLISFETEAQAIKIANQTEYGLAASIWTGNVSNALRVSAEIKAGVVWVNSWMFRDLRSSFGGMKQSGLGREGGFESMKFFTEAKNVSLAE